MDALRTMFLHDVWATQKLIKACAHLTPEQLGATVPGTFGTIHSTLVHLVAAEGRYLKPLGADLPDSPVREGMESSMVELRTRVADYGRQWETIIDRAATLDVTLPARLENTEVTHAEDLLLLQAIHHGNDHRTQVCTILGALGLDVPDLSGWSYWETTRGA